MELRYDIESVRAEIARLSKELLLEPPSTPSERYCIGEVIYEIEESAVVRASNLVHIGAFVTDATAVVLSLGADIGEIRWILPSGHDEVLKLPFAPIAAITMRLVNMLTITSNEDLLSKERCLCAGTGSLTLPQVGLGGNHLNSY